MPTRLISISFMIVSCIISLKISNSNSEGIYASDIEYCIRHYPYTYSKCLQICSSRLEATCIDDQLCFCDNDMQLQNTIDTKQRGNMKIEYKDWRHLGVANLSKCQFSTYCQDNCEIAEYGGHNFTNGVLCEAKYFDSTVKACVCGI